MAELLVIRSHCHLCGHRGPARPTIYEARQAVRDAGWRHHNRTGWTCAACRHTRINRRFQLGITIPLAISAAAMIAVCIIAIGTAFGWWGRD